jgi:hypothetical protein
MADGGEAHLNDCGDLELSVAALDSGLVILDHLLSRGNV